MPRLKRALTVSDLLSFCKSNNFATFSSKETGYQLAVQVPATYEVDEYDSRRGLMRLKIRVFHTGLNRNGSFVSEESAIRAMSSIKNRPLLANIHQLDDGSWDFGAHDLEVIVNEKGEEEYRYIERQIGSFTEDEPWFEENEDRKFVVAYAIVPEDYTKAAEIIRRKNGSKNSCELIIDELSFNAKEKYLDLIDFYVNASTLLGCRDDGTEIGEGMLGSRADIVDFSAENNSTLPKKFEKQLVEMQKKLDELISISRFTIDKEHKKGGGNNLKLNELLKKYKKTIEDITFEYEFLSESELETKFAEMFEENDEGEDVTDSSISKIDENNDNGDSTSTVSEPVNSEDADDNTEVSPNSDDDIKKKKSNNSFSRSVDENGKMTISYEISDSDIRYALYNLLVPFEETDNEWYYIIDVYDTYFIYENCSGGKIYGQKYTKEGDNVAFNGERYALHREFLTDNEYTELQSMRANYAELQKFKSDTEFAQLHLQREEILANKNYAILAEKETDTEGNETYKNKEFEKLVSEMDNYSLEELDAKVKVILAEFVMNSGKFSTLEKQEEKKITVNKKQFSIPTTKTKSSRYGNLFKK